MTKDKQLLKQWQKEEKTRFKGWDFSHLNDRRYVQETSWNYDSIAKKFLKKSKATLDMGTGGGESFSKLLKFHKPKKVVATEGYKPNVSIARRNLKSLGVKVVDFTNLSLKKMPFKDEEFDLVLNKHDAFDAKEVYRILGKGGIFLTQQVDSNDLSDLIKIFHSKRKFRNIHLKSYKNQIKSASFSIKKANEWRGKMIFRDVGAIVYYLKAIPWAVPGFSVRKHLKSLQTLEKRLDKGGKLEFTMRRFFILAQKQ